MNAPYISTSDAESVFMHRAPSAVLEGLRHEDSRAPKVAAKMAAVYLLLGDKIEAFQLSRHALQYRSSLDTRSIIRALMVRGMSGTELTYDTGFRHDFLEALSLIGRDGLEGTDIHVAMMTNWASVQANTGDTSNAMATLETAASIARQMPREWPLRKSRLITARLNLLLMQHTLPDEIFDVLSDLTVTAEADDPFIAAMCHSHVSKLLSRNDLYTAALHHAEQASFFYKEAGRPSQARHARLDVAEIWLNLGMRDVGVAILNEDPVSTGESSWRWATARTLGIRAEQHTRVAAYQDAMAAYESAFELIVDDAFLYPRLLTQDSFVSCLTGLVLTAGRAGNSERLKFWRRELDRVAIMLQRSDCYKADSSSFKVIQYVFEEDEGKQAQLEEELAQAARSLARDDAQSAYLLGQLPHIRGARLEARKLFGLDNSEGVDLTEYWAHVHHLTGEDDEFVRASYRRANLLPVLNRMLARPLKSAWDQFVAVELSRWGSLTGSVGVSYEPDIRGRMRQTFVRSSAARKVTFPAALGDPMRLSHNSQVSTMGAEDSAETISFDDLITRGDWANDPDILQLYMRGRSLHSIHFRIGAPGPVTRHVIDIGQNIAEMLQEALTWSSPQPRQVDNDVLTSAELPLECLLTVAAIRCCLGPFVGNKELARDFGLSLPRRAVGAVFAHLTEIEAPPLDSICSAIGHLITSELMRLTKRPLILSLSNELTQLPFLLARQGAVGDGAVLGLIRPVAILPPVNSLSALGSSASNSLVSAWKLRTVGDATSSLGFAETMKKDHDIRTDLFLNTQESAADVAAVYSGHYVTESVLQPSRAALPQESSKQTLTAAEILRVRAYAPARLALLSCQASGLQFIDEWGGIGSALMTRGAREILAPSWVVIDAAEANVIDRRVGELISTPGHLEEIIHEWHHSNISSWLSHRADAIPPHWWAGLSLMKG